MYRVGLTGGIGSGKSTVSNIFLKLGIPTVDADDISRAVVRKGEPAYTAIITAFGENVIADNGELNRAYLRDIVFSSNKKRKLLESIIHPKVKQEIETQVNKLKSSYCIVSIPLLIESGWEDMVDRILVVDAHEKKRILRTANRDGVSEKQVQSVIKAQTTREIRIKVADDIINNDGNQNKLEKQVKQLHKRYLELARSGA